MTWRKGESGNPRGRPTGTSPVSPLRDSIAEHIPAILVKLVAQAKEGDTTAAKLLLERTLPAVKPVELPTPIALTAEGGLAEQGRSIVAQMAEGALSPHQAVSLLTALGAQARLVELTELEQRVSILEGRPSDGKA